MIRKALVVAVADWLEVAMSIGLVVGLSAGVADVAAARRVRDEIWQHLDLEEAQRLSQAAIGHWLIKHEEEA